MSIPRQAVIIAAGESSRFWPLSNEMHKSQFRLLGKPIIYWTVKGLAENGVKEIIIVVSSQNASLQAELDRENDLGVNILYAEQQKPLGTGDALLQTRSFLKDSFFVFWPNKVNSGEIAKRLSEEREKGAAMALAAAETDTPWDYGVLRMDGDEVQEIVENPKPGQEPSTKKMIGAMLLGETFFEYYEKLPKRHEADLIEALNAYMQKEKAAVVTLENDVPALKYPWEAFGLLDILLHSSNFRPSIAEDAKVAPTAVIKGDVYIGSKAVIGEHTVIEGPCFIGDGCEIGHSNIMRGPVVLENGVKTGALMEMKNSIVQEGTHFHSGYLGDSLIGRHCRFGAGFVSANKRADRESVRSVVKKEKVDTGRKSFGTVVGDGARFGIQSGTMPGVFIGSSCMVGPGTQVFENLPDGTKIFTKRSQERK